MTMRGCAAQPRAGFVGERARGIGLTLDAYQAASVEEPEDASQAPRRRTQCLPLRHAIPLCRMSARGERTMGIGMQIAYFGFAGSAQLEAEASIQLIRLERFSARLAGCHLAIEALGAGAASPTYDVRLDLITRGYELKPIPHMTGTDPLDAIRRAFDAAERELAAALA
ncbi:hypothetical protein BMA721280_I0183 [Burkholderia mallei 2002721280]|nr:hypothetical protein BMA721280_I0183 [Burkholderia mallei 2002721280]